MPNGIEMVNYRGKCQLVLKWLNYKGKCNDTITLGKELTLLWGEQLLMLYTGRGSPALDSLEEGLEERETQIYLSDTSVSTSMGLLHDFWVVQADPLSVGLVPWSLHRPLYCIDGKLSVRWGMNTIWVGRADLSAGSSEAVTGALRATSLGWQSILLQWALRWHMSSWSASFGHHFLLGRLHIGATWQGGISLSYLLSLQGMSRGPL